MSFLDKVQRMLTDRRQTTQDAHNDDDLVAKSLPKYSADNPKPLIEYLLPSERCLLRSSNYESFIRKEKNDTVFTDVDNLDTTIEDNISSSSLDEDCPPCSEELFFEPDEQAKFQLVPEKVPVHLTQAQVALLRAMSGYHIEAKDDEKTIEEKKKMRLELIRGYCKMLKRKRYARTYKRLTRTRAKQLDVDVEAIELYNRELEDKNLFREFYYCVTECPKWSELLDIRKTAIKRKFDLYKSDPQFRRLYRDRVYFNVNQNIPPNDTLHMTSTETEQKPPDEREFSRLEQTIPKVEEITPRPPQVEKSTNATLPLDADSECPCIDMFNSLKAQCPLSLDRMAKKELLLMQSSNRWVQSPSKITPDLVEHRQIQIQRTTNTTQTESVPSPDGLNELFQMNENGTDGPFEERFEAKMNNLLIDEAFEQYQKRSGRQIAERLFKLFLEGNLVYQL